MDGFTAFLLILIVVALLLVAVFVGGALFFNRHGARIKQAVDGVNSAVDAVAGEKDRKKDL